MVIKKISGGANFNDDTLEVLYSKNVKQNRFDEEFAGLLAKVKEPNPRAELVTKLKAGAKVLQKLRNKYVDTNFSIMQGYQNEEDMGRMIEHGFKNIELYTTRHYQSAKRILDFIHKYIESPHEVRERRPAHRIDSRDARTSLANEAVRAPITI